MGILVSFYIFQVQFRFLPPSLNTKIIVAAIGVFLFAVQCIQNHEIRLSRRTLISALIAVAFSLWCLFSMTANGTDDDTYATYWISFATWLGGAYAVCYFIRQRHHRIDLELLTRYMECVCIAQCVIALMIDNIPIVKRIVDSLIVGGPEFYDSINRMYGFGAALDSGGVVFSVVLVLIAHQIAQWRNQEENKKYLTNYLIAFIIITVIGNMIARTTTVGAIIGLGYILFSYVRIQRGGYISGQNLRFYGILAILVFAAVFISISLYNSSPIFRDNLRFAFEGFFNWAETGEFSTGSTDKLNAVMWIWPEDTRSWIIGTGLFGDYVYSTDIGYCRFTLYCGLVGLVIFSIYFLFNHLSIRSKFRHSNLLALCFIVLTFTIWLKVATDIFFIDALLFCIDNDPDEIEETKEVKSSIEDFVVQ